MQPTAIDSKSKNHTASASRLSRPPGTKRSSTRAVKASWPKCWSRVIRKADIDFFEVGGAFEMPAARQTASQDRPLRRYRRRSAGGGRRHLPPRFRRPVGGQRPDAGSTGNRSAGVLGQPHPASLPRRRASITKFFFDHFVHKGQEAAKTCVDTLQKIRAIKRMDNQQARAV